MRARKGERGCGSTQLEQRVEQSVVEQLEISDFSARKDEL